MNNWVSRWLLVAIITVALPFWWLLIDADRGDAPPKPIHMTDLRRLADAMPGQHPADLTYTLLATQMAPGDYLAAGIGLKRRPLAIIAWSLRVPGKAPIMIDPAGATFQAGVSGFTNFNVSRQRRIDAETRVASMVLYGQGHDSELSHPSNPPSMSNVTAQAVAPGVVVIPASSHAPGARLIFVELADGREFLFIGSIATLRENWLRLRARSHLAEAWGPTQDRDETYAWLRTIHQLKMESPTMKVVPGHDYAWLMRQQSKGTILEFAQDMPPPQPVLTKSILPQPSLQQVVARVP
jgi:hypothetical protein